MATSPPQVESCTHGLPKGFLFTSFSFLENVSDSLSGGWAFPCQPESPCSHHKRPQEPWEQPQLQQVRLFSSEATFEDHTPLLEMGPLISALLSRLIWLLSSPKQLLEAPGYSVSDRGVSLWAPPHHLLFPPSSLGIPPAAFGVKLLISAVTAESREPPAPWGRRGCPSSAPQQHPAAHKPIPVPKNISGACRGHGGMWGEASGLRASHAPLEGCAQPRA